MKEKLEKRIDELTKGIESVKQKINENVAQTNELIKTLSATTGALYEAQRMLEIINKESQEIHELHEVLS